MPRSRSIFHAFMLAAVCGFLALPLLAEDKKEDKKLRVATIIFQEDQFRLIHFFFVQALLLFWQRV